MKRQIKKILQGVKNHVKQNINPPGLDEQERQRLRDELREVKTAFSDKDREHVWAFIAGQYSQDFRGNPKYLFVYINKYRPDIATYWLTSTEETIQQVRSLGYRALKLEEPAAHRPDPHPLGQGHLP